MRKNAKFAAAVAVSLVLVLGSAGAAPAGVAYLSPGYDGASIANKVANRADPRLQRVTDSAGASVERLFGKAGITQRLSAY